VQHKITERAAEVWNWLQQGAHIYVCGDAARMARDVENALIEVIETQGKLSRDEAEDYLNDLREDKRYQRDIY
ncbi:MAG: NADPH-dependent assimilatory sulfite reductase flavoprotein subunit, partial [Neisseria sp.]|nr:NADPH-dependent assimilatory sulfite reductase flavoprotein subunit [Neisseria sp.]